MSEEKRKSYECIRGKAEEAIYSKPLLDYDRNNLCISALPPVRTEDEARAFHYRQFPIKPSIHAPVQVQEAEIELLSTLRIPLGYCVRTEDDIYTGLVNSYRKRICDLKQRPVAVTVGNEVVTQDYTMQTPMKGDDGDGIALLGIGGTGKTETITMLLDNYPQQIVHHINNETFHQLVWIKIEPSGNNDLATLFNNFGYALDEALGNTNPVYSRLLEKKKKLGEKSNCIASLIRTFSIGAIIIDEIERLDPVANRKESFESLMTFLNMTKALLVVAGTSEAYDLLFNKYYTIRRISNHITTSLYCDDREFFDGAMSLIMGINWFETEQNLEDKVLLDCLYRETSGKIDLMIKSWKNVQKRYVRLSEEEKENFVLTPDFIRNASRYPNPYMPELTRGALDEDFSVRIKHSKEESAASSPATMTKPAKDSKTSLSPAMMKDILLYRDRLLRLDRGEEAVNVYERVKMNIDESGEEYSDETIVTLIEQVLKMKKSKGMSGKELLAAVLRKLRNKPEEKKPKVKADAKSEINLATFTPAQLDA